LLAGNGVAPLLVTAGLAGKQESVPAKNCDDLVGGQSGRCALTQP